MSLLARATAPEAGKAGRATEGGGGAAPPTESAPIWAGPPKAPSVHDLFCPRPMRREYFVNVALMSKDRQKHASAVAKEHGRSKFGRVGSLLGGAIGNIMASSVTFDDAIADGVRELVKSSTIEALKSKRWWASVTPVALPPLPGKTRWSSFVNLDDEGHLMVFRIFVTGQLPEEKGNGGDCYAEALSWLFSSCCAEAPEDVDPEQRIADDVSAILHEVQHALASRKNPIFAELVMADAKEEYETLFDLNWSRELCAEAINASRMTGAQQGNVA